MLDSPVLLPTDTGRRVYRKYLLPTFQYFQLMDKYLIRPFNSLVLVATVILHILNKPLFSASFLECFCLGWLQTLLLPMAVLPCPALLRLQRAGRAAEPGRAPGGVRVPESGVPQRLRIHHPQRRGHAAQLCGRAENRAGAASVQTFSFSPVCLGLGLRSLHEALWNASTGFWYVLNGLLITWC